MGSGKLLFVNKTPSSTLLTQSEPRERAQILRHVQRNRRKAEGNKPHALPPWSGQVYALNLGPDTRETEAEATRSSVSLRGNYPSSNSSDPFHCTVAGTDHAIHALLRCVFSSEFRSNFLAEAFAPASIVARGAATRHESIFARRLQQCVIDQTLMYATLAYGSSFIGWASSRRESANSRAGLQQPPEYYLGKAIRGVRERLALASGFQSTPDDWLMLSIYSLAITELWNGMPETWGRPGDSSGSSETANKYSRATLSAVSSAALAACRIHLSAALSVVIDVGGWHYFDPYILDSFLLVDKFLAIHQLTAPMIPPTWDPGPLYFRSGNIETMLEQGAVNSQQMGAGFADTSMTARLRSLIRDIISFCVLAEACWSSKEAMTFKQESWLFRRLQALTCRLLACYHAESTVVGQCISLTAIVFLFSCTSHRGPQLGALYAARHLKYLLLHSGYMLVETGHVDLYRWSLFTGAMIVPSREGDWLIAEFVGLYRNFHVAHIAVLQQEMERFLFLAARQRGRLMELMERASAFGS